MFEIRILKPSDDRTSFRSGNTDLDRFFASYAGQNQFRHHIGTTYVAVEDDLIKGFVTVSASHIEIDQIPDSWKKRLPGYPLPVLRLARLAVDESAKPHAISFYERYGFIRLESLEGILGDRPEPVPMFLSLGSISKAAGSDN